MIGSPFVGSAMPDNFTPDTKDLLNLLVGELNEFVIVLTDVDGRFVSWHPGVKRQFNYELAELIGQNLELLLPRDERGQGVGSRELAAVAENGRTSDTRWLAKKNGETILVEGVTIALRHKDTLVGFGKVLRDITEQKQVEKSLRALTRALDQTMVIVRRWDGVITHWTAGCERLYGWQAEEAKGRICQDLLKTKFPISLEQIQAELLERGHWIGEVEHTRQDDTQLAIATHWVLLNNDKDEPLVVIETQTDITVRSQAQREAESANRQLHNMALELERSNEELEEFARIASHDLSSPITSTRWLVDLLAARHSNQLTPDAQAILQQIAQGLERMSNLVEGILAHAQVGRTLIAQTQPTSANAALKSAIENLCKDIEISGATINSADLPQLEIDPQALSQLFQNLLSNALKYRSPDRPPVVNLVAVREDSMWLFSVKDNGIGIEPDWLERVFQPMQRRHEREISGSGIGLATCKKIVTRAGGRIWAESDFGSGSTFYFLLPGPAPD